ncbi:MAG: hypothetical protein OEY22_05285 [Candidatus Bathyarchaeota archaeon]|nr:hypothetical protein [Candidatus Bathyarchaeota archaeon]MDH5788076.1 hypothetical protein [Candidatus Bathyarchaeota archaeon]
MSRREWTEEEKFWVREGLILFMSWFIYTAATSFFGMEYITSEARKSGISLFAAVKMVLLFVYIVDFFPATILIEFAYKRVKKRSFRPLNVFIGMLLFGEAVLVTYALCALFDVLFSHLSYLIQLPLLSICLSIPSVLVAFTSRTRKVSTYLKKAFE